MSNSKSVSREFAEMERDIRDQNREVRAKTHCEECGDKVPDSDYSCKYAAAGGVLAGPFCSSECYWGWMS
jgi:hypothetical protein